MFEKRLKRSEEADGCCCAVEESIVVSCVIFVVARTLRLKVSMSSPHPFRCRTGVEVPYCLMYGRHVPSTPAAVRASSNCCQSALPMSVSVLRNQTMNRRNLSNAVSPFSWSLIKSNICALVCFITFDSVE